MQSVFLEPFIEASQYVLNKTAKLNIKLGEICTKALDVDPECVGIYLGINGKLRGQVVFCMNKSLACDIAGSMMGRGSLQELDKVSRSAVTELTNIILGQTASILSEKGYKIDITPPCFILGDNMHYIVNRFNTVCVPFLFENGAVIEAEIAIL